MNLLNPTNDPGRLTLILRLGASKVREVLPPIVEAIKKDQLNVTWVSDAVHGNTYITDTNFKVRDVDTILKELVTVNEVLEENDQILGGIHLEASGENVTECLGGITQTTNEDLVKNYATYCDPRLNFVQTLYVVHKFCRSIQKGREL